MASIGDLVVNLTANSRGFQAGLKKSQSSLKSFASSAARTMAGIGAAIGGASAVKSMIDLAVESEQTAVKFRVLLKDGNAAAAMLDNINKFAAKTPFQKMELADAAQKLLAFNVPAGDVMKRLKDIGDISALTGNRIGELSELYGKAHVQGRLFMEDINQLTGRGIPIIQELAKQFGVAESEVRGLVSAGAVSADNISQAFADMTAAGGQFNGGMEQLSQTTGGVLSTLKDNIALIATNMGQSLLPAINRLATGFLSLMEPARSVFRFVEDLVGDSAATIFAVANNLPSVWAGAFKDIPVFAGAAFEWVRVNVLKLFQNIAAVAKALPSMLSNTGKNLGEEIAFKLGLSDEKMEFDPLEKLKGTTSFTSFKMPEFSQETKDVLSAIDDSVKNARAEREAGRKQPAEFVFKPTEAAKVTNAVASAVTDTAKATEMAASSKTSDSQFAGVMERGSVEAVTAIFKSQRNNPQTKLQKTANKHLASIEKAIKSKPVGFDVQGAV